jgi:hypothetical protein
MDAEHADVGSFSCAGFDGVPVIPDQDLGENGVLIVTGSSLQAERQDRPLAYHLKSIIEHEGEALARRFAVVVLSDLWYLNSEPLHRLPTIAIGNPCVNALAAHLLKRLPNALFIDDALLIQMDMNLEDLRASIWGADYPLTANALELFVKKGYLQRFLEAVLTRSR